MRLDALDLPPRPRILAVEAEDYVDWSGDEALRVWATIAEDTTDEDVLSNGKAISRLKNSIHHSLLANGITLFPFITLTRPSERYLTGDEE